MRRVSAIRWAVLALAPTVIAACFTSFTDPTAVEGCDEEGGCLSGYLCRAGRCVPVDSADACPAAECAADATLDGAPDAASPVRDAAPDGADAAPRPDAGPPPADGRAPIDRGPSVDAKLGDAAPVDAACQPLPETCNRVDDDCDGEIDEDLGCECEPGERRACDSDLGECIAGEQGCEDESRWGACVASVGPRPESCDGLDNDCDGDTDEDLEAPPCEIRQGVCAAARRRCGAVEGWLPCAPEDYGERYRGQEGPDDCDGLDNDCDGLVDDLCLAPELLTGTYALLGVLAPLPERADASAVAGTIRFDGAGGVVFDEWFADAGLGVVLGLAPVSTYVVNRTHGLRLRVPPELLGGAMPAPEFDGALDLSWEVGVLVLRDEDRPFPSVFVLLHRQQDPFAHLGGAYRSAALHSIAGAQVAAGGETGRLVVDAGQIQRLERVDHTGAALADGVGGVVNEEDGGRIFATIEQFGYVGVLARWGRLWAMHQWDGFQVGGVSRPFPHLVLAMPERAEAPRIALLEGQWRVSGLVAPDELGTPWNAAEWTFDLAADGAWTAVGAGAPIDRGRVEVGAAGSVELWSGPPRAEVILRGQIDSRDEMLLLWQVDADGSYEPSLLVALRAPRGDP